MRMRKRKSIEAKAKPPRFREYCSDPDRTDLSLAAGLCRACGCDYVYRVRGDDGIFYQCAVCGSGVWLYDPDPWSSEEEHRCAWCGCCVPHRGMVCPGCGRLVDSPEPAEVIKTPDGEWKINPKDKSFNVVSLLGRRKVMNDVVFPSRDNIKRS